MTAFKDGKGDTWVLRIDVGAVRRLIDQCDFDVRKICEVNDGKMLLAELHDDPLILTDVCYCILQYNEKSREEFESIMDGDTLRAAFDSAVETIADFSPSQTSKETLLAMVAKLRQVEQVMQELSMEEMDKVDLEVVREALTKQSGNSLAESVSTPPHSPSVNSA